MSRNEQLLSDVVFRLFKLERVNNCAHRNAGVCKGKPIYDRTQI